MSYDESSHSVLLTKLTPPPARARQVARPRLLALLEEGTTRPLTLVVAGAGFGKTTLVAQWLHTADHLFAWITLETGENTPLRFWTYVLTAIERAAPGVAMPTLQLLQSSQPPAVEMILPQFLNALTTMAGGLTVVLDDYHVIETSAIHQQLAVLIERLPAHCHVVVTTRANPPLPLARLRARDQLVEVRAADLRFDSDEIVAFLTHGMRIQATPEQIAALETKTEGWVAGLQLVALALRGHSDLTAMVRGLSGSQRYILDYLVEEVLQSQPQHIQRFLLQTAILERLSGPLCDAVMGVASAAASGEPPSQPYSQLLLDDIEHQYLFLIPLDDERRWYRFHHLFATALHALLQQRAPELVGELHQRASAWYLAHAEGDELLMDSAFAHAQASKEMEQTVAVVEQLGPVLLERYASHTLRNWLAALPDALFQTHSRLAQLRAWLLILEGKTAAAEPWVARAEANLPTDMTEMAQAAWSSEMAMLRGMIAWRNGDLAFAATQYRYALEHLPERSVLRSVAAVNYGTLAAMLGEPRAAAAAFAEGVRLTLALDRPLAVQMLCQQAQMEAIQGRLAHAEQLCHQAMERAERDPVRHAPYMPTALVGLGELHYERNMLDAAADAFSKALQHVSHLFASDALLRGETGLARVHAARGNLADARRRLANVERAMTEQRAPSWYLVALATARAQLALAAGDRGAAQHWLNDSGLHPDNPALPTREAEYMLLARIMIAQGRSDAVYDLLERMRQSAETAGRVGSLVAILALQTLAEPARHEMLDAALRLADSHGYVRTLVDLGTTLVPALRAAAARKTLPNYVAQVLAALGDQSTGHNIVAEHPSPSQTPAQAHLIEPLSPRELEVLHLLAGGATNQEIANRLVIAERTAKKHVTNILGKLGAANRTHAVARAREVGLL